MLLAAPVVPYVPLDVKDIVATVNYGFTFGKVTAPSVEIDAAIREVFRTRHGEICENLTKNNVVLMRLEGDKYVQINKEDPREQEKRIIEAMQSRRDKITDNEYANRRNKVGSGKHIFYEGYSEPKIDWS
jgi:hypothetical protein